ncbi:MAG: ABC transporter permease [Deltaproteobacteria bacterium]|nr:ABC transporter permease [Deltaproteobacteria bacterium]MBW2047713.1 ABC transporter permease [Deltaproteobacteria bacterium]MBW2111334.1 ABC transporter permease [Deltaproteobacteria bacterium]MBW2354501.1 ABC transporter permease [Deltaproteobacteria bacterium]HDZ91374.1 ABC transporter permease subunit [Deltaproteobacteria bacterium]
MNSPTKPFSGRKGFKLAFSGLSLLLLILVSVPLLRMILSADPEALRSAVADREVMDSIFLTLRAALWATVVCTVLGIPLSYLLARWNFRGKSLVQGLVDLPVMIPHTAAGIALLMVYGRSFFLGKALEEVGLDFVGTELGISLAMAYVSLPFLVNAARDGFLAVDPKLERVARTLGASPWQSFFRVTLPLAWRPVLSGGIMMWARGISEFGAVVILTYHPMTAPILIWERFQAYGLKYAKPVAVLLILLCLLIFALLRWLAEPRKEG